MTATYASRHWPLLPDSPRRAPWLFGRELALDGRADGPRVLQWLLKRNCSITPRQLAAFYLSLCGVSLAIGGWFFAHGAPLVLAFAGVELLAVGVALLLFARHAGDHETLTLVGRSLHVQQCRASRVEHTEFTADWLTVEPAAGQGSLVELSGRGRTVRIGRFLRPELRAAFARELRQALRQAPVSLHAAPATDTN